MVGTQTRQKQLFLMQGSILATAGILVRIIGLIYRIPMIAIIGTEGNGYYTSAYSVYSLFLILSSYSFPTAISKILSQRLANGRFVDAKNVVITSFKLAFIVGIVMFALLFFGAPVISVILRKPMLSFALKALAPTLFIMAFLGVLRGVFQGMGNMIPTAISQVFEQIANAVSSVVLAFILFNRGLVANLVYNTDEYSYAFGAMGGAIGTGVGTFVALIILIYIFLNLISKYKKFLSNNNNFPIESNIKINNVLFFTIVPIIISSTIYNITSVLDDLLFSNILSFIHSNENIVILWGIYGQYHLIFNIPVAISNSLTSSIIPSISSSAAQNDVRQVVLKVKYSTKYTMLIVMPSFIGITILARPICKVLFDGENVDILINVLKVGAIAIVFFSLSTVTNGILQGLGLFKKTVKNAFIALLIHIASCFIFLIPLNLSIYGIIFSMIVFSIVLSILNQYEINKVIKYKNSALKFRFIITYIFMFLSAIIMGIIVSFIYFIVQNKFNIDNSKILMVLTLITCIVIAVFIYMFLIIFFGVVRKRDSEYIPFISKFSFMLKG